MPTKKAPKYRCLQKGPKTMPGKSSQKPIPIAWKRPLKDKKNAWKRLNTRSHDVCPIQTQGLYLSLRGERHDRVSDLPKGYGATALPRRTYPRWRRASGSMPFTAKADAKHPFKRQLHSTHEIN